MARCHGQLQRLSDTVLHADAVVALLQPLCQAARLDAADAPGERDFAVTLPPAGRLRVNQYWQQRGPAAAIRLIPSDVPALAALGLPAALPDLVLRPHGLLLVVGATGSGKSTTLAALLDHINRQRAGHILTIEDPVEYLHTSQQCLISQRELGRDTGSFSAALRAALREDPDVLLIGELRDLESIRLALTAAETGHLVLATLHAASAPRAVERIVDVFPSGDKELVRQQLADSLLAVLTQTLHPRADGAGRVAAFELLTGTPAVRNLIREGRSAQLLSAMQTGAAHGMLTMAQHLEQLRRAGLIRPAAPLRKPADTAPVPLWGTISGTQ